MQRTSMKARLTALRTGQVLGFASAFALAAWLSDPLTPRPAALFALLAAMTLITGAFPLKFKGVRASGMSLGIVLAAVLISPLAAALIATVSCTLQSAARRLGWGAYACNL